MKKTQGNGYMTRILCIEDEELLREDLVEELRDAGHNVIEAGNGRSGLDIILQQHPDLVLCDINMPDMNGFELLTTLRKDHPEFDDVPFIFLPALADRKDVIAGKRLGADDYLTKPVDFELLHATIESRLRQVQRMIDRKEEQLVRLYRALSSGASPEAPGTASGPDAGAADASNGMSVVAVVDTSLDLSELRALIESRGHSFIVMNSGKQFLECQDSLQPDILLLSFNTSDMQASMIVRLVSEAPYPKVLLVPPTVSNIQRNVPVPGFDAVIDWPCDARDLEIRIAEVAATAA